MTQVYKPGTGNETVVQVDATAGNETIALPAGFAAGRKFTIRRVDSGASGHTVTITVPAGQTLDGTVDGSFTVPANGEGWLTPTDPGIWESFGLRNSLVTVDADGSLVVDGTTVEVGSDAEIASALALKLDTTTATATFAPILNVQLLAWTLAQAFRVVSATRDANDAITTASVVWPDGSTGTFTTDTASTSFPGAIDAYHVTYVNVTTGTKTVTQTAVTRNGNGAVTAQPALTVA